MCPHNLPALPNWCLAKPLHYCILGLGYLAGSTRVCVCVCVCVCVQDSVYTPGKAVATNIGIELLMCPPQGFIMH